MVTDRDFTHHTPAGPVVQKRDSHGDFMCVCDDKNRAITEACLARVCEALDCEPHEVVSKVVYSVTWGLPNEAVGSVTGIPCDMWCAVTGELSKGEEEHSFFVQCDVVEHGFARLYELMMEVASGEQQTEAE
jgi:hypothetical protein